MFTFWKKKRTIEQYFDRLRPTSPLFDPEALLREIPEIAEAGLINERESRPQGPTLLNGVCGSTPRDPPTVSIDKRVLAQALLAAGADPLIGRRDDKTAPQLRRRSLVHDHALARALRLGDRDLAELLFGHCAPTEEQQPWLWVFAVEGGDPASVALLQEKGVSWGTGVASGAPLWHHAPDVGGLEVLRQALPDLPLNLVNEDGRTVGHLDAVYVGDTETGDQRLEKLAWWISEGGDPTLKGSDGGNALTLALWGFLSGALKAPGRPCPESLWKGIELLRAQGCSLAHGTLTYASGQKSPTMDVLIEVLKHVMPQERLRLLDTVLSSREWLTPDRNGVLPLSLLAARAPTLTQALRERWLAHESASKMMSAMGPSEASSPRRPRL